MLLHFASSPSNHVVTIASRNSQSESWGLINVGELRDVGHEGEQENTLSHAMMEDFSVWHAVDEVECGQHI